jgi:hypothetical protein
MKAKADRFIEKVVPQAICQLPGCGVVRGGRKTFFCAEGGMNERSTRSNHGIANLFSFMCFDYEEGKNQY